MTRRISLAALLLAAITLGGLAVRATDRTVEAEAEAPAEPAPTAQTGDGTVVATDDGRFYFLWEGGKQRIQQPAAFDEGDLSGAGLRIGPPAPRVLAVGAPAESRLGTRFVMVPADGPDARLHLLQGATLHPLDVATVEADVLASLPDLVDTVIDGVRIP